MYTTTSTKLNTFYPEYDYGNSNFGLSKMCISCWMIHFHHKYLVLLVFARILIGSVDTKFKFRPSRVELHNKLKASTEVSLISI